MCTGMEYRDEHHKRSMLEWEHQNAVEHVRKDCKAKQQMLDSHVVAIEDRCVRTDKHDSLPPDNVIIIIIILS